MDTAGSIVAIIVAGIFIYLLIRMVRHQPQAFSKENFSKSAFTLGILALILIVVVLLGILFLSH